MKSLLTNWKTTLAGVAAILTAAAHIANSGHFDPSTDGTALMVGLGLIMAKDHNADGQKP